jgi:hypothetical protein
MLTAKRFNQMRRSLLRFSPEGVIGTWRKEELGDKTKPRFNQSSDG